MIDLLLYGLLVLAGGLLVVNVVRNTFTTKNELGIEGKLIWVDKGKSTKPFFNNTFEVLGKPDLMYRVLGGVLAVEYKSRNGPIYQSDEAQAKCAALAARGNGYRVIRILLKTNTLEQYIDLPTNDITLFNEIKAFVVLTRQAKSGDKMNALPTVGKCRSCAFKYECRYSAH